jgi:hypothetical protein
VVHLIFPISIRSALHAVLIALAFQVQAGGSNVTAARADENSETLYLHRGHSIGKASLNKQTQEERPNFR